MSESKPGKFLKLFFLLVVSVTTGGGLRAQSLDARFPAPVRTSEIVGRIRARDLGDARLTSHFYTFKGTPGDLLITVETRNLNGDVDIFTAGTLRPVFKVALYAELTSPVTKSIYLRQTEDLILRVEARSPNDDHGTYRVSFGGSFQPVAAAEAGSEEIAAALPAARKGKRVSSVGARVDETTPPALAVSEAPTPEPSAPSTEDPPPAEPRSTAETPVEIKTETVETPRPPRSRTSRGRSPTRRASSTVAKKVGAEPTQPAEETSKQTETEEVAKTSDTKGGTEESKREAAIEITEAPVARAKKSSKKSRPVTAEPTEATDTTPPESATPRSKTTTARARGKSNTSGSGSSSATITATPEDLARSKLIIEMLDGTRIERFMNTIRRVDVESGQIVVTGIDGNIERIRLARVVRMSIGQ